MNSYRAEGIVLRARDLGEGNKLLTVFTRQYGKIKAVAYGAAKPGSKKRGAVLPFCRSAFLISRGKELDTVSQCEGVEMFSSIYDNLDLMSYASYFTELVDALSPEGEPNIPLFVLLLTALKLLGEVDGRLLARSFELKALTFLGLQPELKQCASCGGELAGAVFFAPAAGGAVCGACAVNYQKTSLSPAGLGVMRTLLRLPPARVKLLKVSERTGDELAVGLKRFLEYHLERKAKSLAFLEDVGTCKPGAADV